MYDSYADVLESYMIAEEGIMDKIKSAGKVIFETVRKVLRVIKEGLLKIVNKLKSFGNKDSNNNNTGSTVKNVSNPKEEEMRLKQENEELKKQIAELTSSNTNAYNENRDLKSKLNSAENDKRELNYSLKNRDAKIKELKDQISKNNEKIEELTKSNNAKYNDAYVKGLNRELTRYMAMITVQNNKACMALPKIINKIKSSANMSDDEYNNLHKSIYDSLSLKENPDISRRYRIIRLDYLPQIKENNYSLMSDFYLKRTCSDFVKQTTTVIEHLEKAVNQFEDIYNNYSKKEKYLCRTAMSILTEEGGTIYSLRLSVNLVNYILRYADQNETENQ